MSKPQGVLKMFMLGMLKTILKTVLKYKKNTITLYGTCWNWAADFVFLLRFCKSYWSETHICSNINNLSEKEPKTPEKPIFLKLILTPWLIFRITAWGLPFLLRQFSPTCTKLLIEVVDSLSLSQSVIFVQVAVYNHTFRAYDESHSTKTFIGEQ